MGLGIFVSDKEVLAIFGCNDEIGDHPIATVNPDGPVEEWLPGSRQVKQFPVIAYWTACLAHLG